MPNGKGTMSCLECNYSFFKSEPNDPYQSTQLCSKWEVPIPNYRYRTLNLFCSDFESSKHSKYPRLKSYWAEMIEGMLYAVFYNDIPITSKWRAVYNLQTKLFIDGRAKEIKPVIYNGVKYTAPHFKYIKMSNIWVMHDQNGGFVEARDETTGELLWDLIVYKTSYNSWRSMEKQDVFITSLKIENENLVVTNEKNKKYLININTQKIKK